MAPGHGKSAQHLDSGRRSGGLLEGREGSGLFAEKGSAPAHGQLKLHADGSFTYQPEKDFIGTDSFEYRVIMDSKKTNTAAVSLRVMPVSAGAI